MADFTIDVSRSKTSRINLGIQGENIIEHIIFDISSWIEEFGDGVAYIYAQRKGDENPYPVALDMDLDAGTATWTITDADTAVKGKGKAQLVFVSDDEDSITDVEVYSSSSTYSVGDYCLYGTQLYKCKTTISTAEAWTPAHWDAVNEVKKTRVYATTVQASLVSTSSENPDAYETWLEVLGGYTARIEAAEDELEDYVQNNTIADVTLNSTSIVEDRVAEIPLASSSGHGAMSSTDKSKLDGIEAGAEVNVQADWNQTDNTEDDYIKNKPVNATTSVGGLMSATDKSKLDGIASGAEVNVQADWNQSDSTADDYIKNKPTIPTGDYSIYSATLKELANGRSGPGLLEPDIYIDGLSGTHSVIDKAYLVLYEGANYHYFPLSMGANFDANSDFYRGLVVVNDDYNPQFDAWRHIVDQTAVPDTLNVGFTFDDTVLTTTTYSWEDSYFVLKYHTITI